MTSHNYNQSHDHSTTSAHSARTAEVEAAFLLPHLQPHFRVLDLGCGPGSISRGIAGYVKDGSVVGVDLTEEILTQARHGANEARVGNITFEQGDILNGLNYPAGHFDVVFCSQTLLHIPDPVKALKEIKRLLKPGGFVAAREADMPFHWYPYNRGLQLWDKYLYMSIFGQPGDQEADGANREHPMNQPHGKEYRGGSLLHVWMRKAGFNPEKMEKNVGSQAYTTPATREWFVQTYTKRLDYEETRRRMKACGASEADLEEMILGFREWGSDVDGWMAILHAEVIARV